MAEFNLINRIRNLFTSNQIPEINAFNKAFYSLVGQAGTQYDINGKTYIEKGYNTNAAVYAVVNQMATKAASVPFFIRKSIDEQKTRQFLREIKQDNETDFAQFKLRKHKIERKAFETVDGNPDFLEPPFPNPNPHQTWTEFFNLSETFLRLTGNLYYYMPNRQSGTGAGEPYAIYILPSHLMQIVLKANADLLLDVNPVSYYMLTQFNKYTTFPADEVVHITFSNPNFNFNGEHLYGQSPLRAALNDIALMNEGKVQSTKTMKNSGAFGLIHGKNIPLQPHQAEELKDRLKEMDNDDGRLGRIGGVSTELGFLRLSLTADELKPFEYFSFSQKQICNVLGWSDKLLNNDAGAKYDNVKEFRKQVITDTIAPDLGLIEQAFNRKILPKFAKYQNTIAYFDFSLLPEMQADQETLVKWLTVALKDGVITRNEYREAMSFDALEDEIFNQHTVQGLLMPLNDALDVPDDDENLVV